ncbi:efflux RND transporter periplasmic adaptor subunit [bacterium]|nr:efflux RND transporter periplasmic adaptor subunit [bacterium]
MSKKAKILIFSGALVVIVAFVLINLKKARGDVFEVQTTKVQRGDITQLVSGSGKIQPEKEVKISAFVSAEIIKLHVREGDPVEAGRLLSELDRNRYEAALERSKSNLKSAHANLKKARSDLKRAQDLFAKKLNSEADLEGAEANFELMESQVEQAEANLTQAEDDLSKTRLISPISGTVAKLNKEEGEIALGSQFQADVIMTVADLTKMEMVAEIDENDVVLVAVGDSADIEVDALPDRVFQGIVTEIAHTATTRGRGTQEEVTNFDVTIAVRDDVDQLRPGMSATVDIKTETHEDVLYVPIQAITMRERSDTTDVVGKFSKKTWRTKKGATKDENDVMFGPDQGGADGGTKARGRSESEKMVQVVFVITDGVANMIPVDTGLSSEKNVEILSELDEDAQIVSGSFRVLTKQLKEGSKVKVKNKEGKASRNPT